MAIDFTLTPQQRELQLESRRFATEVLAGARAAELLPTAEERRLAAGAGDAGRVVAGFLRKCIPQPAGGENAGLIDMAIMAEEFYSVNASVTLTMLGTVLGLFADLAGRHAGAVWPAACSVLEEEWNAVGRLLLQRTGRQRQRRFSAARRRRAHHCQTSGATAGSSMAGRNGSLRRPDGIVKVRISYAWCAGPRLTLHPRKRFPSSRSNALHPVSSSSAQSSPWVTARISRRNSVSRTFLRRAAIFSGRKAAVSP